MKSPFPASLRGRLTLVLTIGSLILVAALIGGFNVVLRNQIRSDVNARLKERASAALANVSASGNRLVIREAPGDEAIDQQVWVFANRRVVEAPRESARTIAAARAAAARPGRFADLPSGDLRFYSQPVRRQGRTVGAVVAGASLAPYETTARRALVASIVLGLLIVAAVLTAVRLAISAALRPVDRMTAEASTWSVDDLDHRFTDAGTHDELARLASTFNALLARLAASFRHEQRFSAELSHELRTPLAKLIIECELALRRDRSPAEYRTAIESVVRDARQMQGVIETLLAVARSEIDPRSGTADAAAVARSVAASLEMPNAAPFEVAVHPTNGCLRVGVDAEVAERILAPVVANALQFADHYAAIEVHGADSTIHFIVRDDGPGVPPRERESVFVPGFRGSTRPPSAHGQGTGLGLALSRRLARAADGDVTCADLAEGGAAFVVTLPAA